MKAFWISIAFAIFFWSSAASAEYCMVSPENKTSCIYKINRIPHNSQIIISYTQQGWSMMIVVFRDEFAIIEGDSRVETKHGEEQTIKYVSTRRDMVSGKMMEAALYMVTEPQLREWANASGKIRFYLAATALKKGKEVEVEVAAKNFADVDAYIAETKTVLADLFEEK
ncbi:MAG: hypothetical protein WBS20_10620 [Lysobacterales bacterium]